MTRSMLASATLAALLLALPATAQTMQILLPDLDYPVEGVTGSTKAGDDAATPVRDPQG